MKSCKKILIYHQYGIGDTIIIAPAITCIVRHFKDAEIDVFNTHQNQGAYHMTLFENLGNFRKIEDQQLYDCFDMRHLFRRIHNLYRLRKEEYDCAFVFFLYGTPRWWLWLFKLFTGIKTCYHTKDYRKYDNELFYSLQKQMEEYGFTFNESEKKLIYPITEKNIRNAELFSNTCGIPKDSVPFSMCISGISQKYLSWTVEQYSQLLKRITPKYHLYPLVFGASREKELCEQMFRSAGCTGTFVSDLSGPDAIAVMEKCSFYLGNDTGPMHMANSAGIPCIALFSDRDAYGTWFPVGDHNKVIIHRLPCEGCLKRICPKGNPAPCVAAITIDEVENAVDEVLSRYLNCKTTELNNH